MTRQAGRTLLAHAPETTAASPFQRAAVAVDICDGDADDDAIGVADRFQDVVIPERP
ncbi:MAG: hypothetical protein J07HQW2_02716 [Haloquadratum walsbyi J07HQW2]|jgi:septum site-determining protein MinD|uniref:Uncharacterized protein n=1 Tax=Haloquadratum walsbyi J07HQW2 TaxID=1238425 RepID=U1PV19_9EURY|nr:MAG: hypothetical protein J07HQW2_02716 [Haloquadratum walsbyi J07HQW2]